MGRTDLTEEQWSVIRPLIPVSISPGCRGRPWCPDREVLNGILWILKTGAAWNDLPPRYPSKATCHRRFQKWCRDGTFRKIFEALAHELDQANRIHWNELMVDGSLTPAKKKGHKRPRVTGQDFLERAYWPLWMLAAYL